MNNYWPAEWFNITIPLRHRFPDVGRELSILLVILVVRITMTIGPL